MEGFIGCEKGDVVVFQFPFSDASKTKKRPSLVVAELAGNDVILCQITGQPRPDPDLIELKIRDFQTGRISRDSFIRPSVLFTIHKSRLEYKAGRIKPAKIKQVQEKLCEIFSR